MPGLQLHHNNQPYDNEMEDLLAYGMERQLHDRNTSSDEKNADLSLSPAAKMAKYVALKTVPNSIDTLEW